MHSYQQLIVWQRSMQLVAECYRLTSTFPQIEQFGLTIQLRRAAVSVAANIAEGNGRAYRKEYAQFLSTARGSLNEVETLIGVGIMLQYASGDDSLTAKSLADEIGRMLTVLRRRLLAAK